MVCLNAQCHGSSSRHKSKLTVAVWDGLVPPQARRGGRKGAACGFLNGAAASVEGIVHQQGRSKGGLHPGVGHLGRGQPELHTLQDDVQEGRILGQQAPCAVTTPFPIS